jgi:hypothetical protein
MVTVTQLKKVKKTAKAHSAIGDITYQQALEKTARELGFKTYQSLVNAAAETGREPLTEIKTQFDAEMLALPESLDTYRESLLLSSNAGFQEVYAPFDYVNLSAKIAIVGLTPGDQQARNALRSYREARNDSSSPSAALKSAKKAASFSGPMRTNLVSLLDYVGINSLLSIPTTAELFNPSAELAHFTSLLRNPIFLDDKNYSGTPSPVRNEYLWSLVSNGFAHEIANLPELVWVPLGSAVKSAFERLIEEKQVDPARVLMGLPHPSGANMERINFFLEKKSRDDLSDKTNPESLELARVQLCNQVKALGGIAKPNEVEEVMTMIEENPKPAVKKAKKTTDFLKEDVDKKVARLAVSAGYSVKPIKNVNTKVLELKISRAGITESIYIDRGVGLSKDQIQVTIRPQVADKIDGKLVDIPRVEAHFLKRDVDNQRNLFSSNYSAFENKGKDMKRHEHFGRPYRIDIQEGYDSVGQFLATFRD